MKKIPYPELLTHPFYVPGFSGSFIRGIQFQTLEQVEQEREWCIDVGPGGIAYSYVANTEFGPLRKSEIPFERTPRRKR